MHDVDFSIAEAERAIKMGARGVQTFTNIAGHPLDEPRFRPFFAAMAKHDLPVWLHPARTSAMADYTSEPRSRFEMWWCFGWPYETTIAMCRLVFDGIYDRHPKLKIITHHLGGGMIPFFDGRIGAGMEVLGQRTLEEDHTKVLSSLKRPHLEYFKEFYADTAMFGGTYGLPCGLEFFGGDQRGVCVRRAARRHPDAHQGARRPQSRRRDVQEDHARQRREAVEHENQLNPTECSASVKTRDRRPSCCSARAPCCCRRRRFRPRGRRRCAR